MSDSTKNDKQEGTADLSAIVQFDTGEFEQRLAGVQQDFQRELSRAVVHKEPEAKAFKLDFNIPDAAGVKTQPVAKKTIAEEAPQPQSGFLASLAQEAMQSQHARNQQDQGKFESNRKVHEALDRVLKFFLPFIKHVNTVSPQINRSYRLDARSIYTNLKWHNALVDARKQGAHDDALHSYVTFSVSLLAPEPVPLKRPWSQFDAVVKELAHFKISSLDDLHYLHKHPQTEWLEARLDPALPVHVHFQGNYELGKVDVLTRNLQDFGQTALRLDQADISVPLLEELGMFLISRSDKLPEKLQATPK